MSKETNSDAYDVKWCAICENAVDFECTNKEGDLCPDCADRYGEMDEEERRVSIEKDNARLS